jgi:hypothetical protein
MRCVGEGRGANTDFKAKQILGCTHATNSKTLKLFTQNKTSFWLWCLPATYLLYYFNLLSSRLHILLCFVAWHHIYFIFARDLVRVFLLLCARSKQNKYWDALMQPLLCMNQEYISALKSERLSLCWHTLILFTVYI